MITLSPKERRDLHHVFSAISDKPPRRKSVLLKLRFMMQKCCFSPAGIFPEKLFKRRFQGT